MNKSAIEKFAVWARKKFISEITYKMGLLGISDKGIAEPLPQSSGDLQLFDIGTKNYAEVAGTAIRQRSALVQEIQQRERTSDYATALSSVVEEVAYTWFNRLVAIRFMEVNDYLPSGIRVLSSENSAKAEPDFVTTPFDTDLTFSSYEQDRIIQLKDENKLDELFRMLFIKQCNKLHEILPELFEKTDDYTELLLTISFTDKDGVVYHLTHDISEDDFHVEKEGQVEIIGWMYQYYNTELKADTFAQLKKNIKITKERIPAATQLFTPHWIVRYMVENSLGRLWVEGHPNDSLKSEWKYYLDETEQEESVKAELEKIRKEYSTLNPEDIKVADPCMGSGHILVYAFDVLMQIYESCGYTQRDAAKSILTNNIYGLDIDKRAYQLSYFSLMMKARQYSRRILNENIRPNVFVTEDSAALSTDIIDYIANGDLKMKADLQSIANDLCNAKEYGSLIAVSPVDFAAIYRRIDEIKNGELNLFSSYVPETIMPIIRQAEVLAQKYDVVVTNPPYMGNGSMNSQLSYYVKNNFPDEKADLFACFISRGNSMVKQNRYNCMVTMQSWMFLSSFEKMRIEIISTRNIINLMHMENMVMGIAFGTAVTVFQNNYVNGYKGTYNQIKLHDIINNIPKVFPIPGNRFAQISTDNFSKIPGSPVAYWISENIVNTFEYPALGSVLDTREGMATANNDLFLRLWYEIAFVNISYGLASAKEMRPGMKWVPYNKGGEFRKWYGNNDFVVNWENDGFEIRNNQDFKTKRIRSHNYNGKFGFRKGITWSALSSAKISVRYAEQGFLFDSKGAKGFAFKNDILLYAMALINSTVGLKYLEFISPTIDFKVGDIIQIPYIGTHGSEITQLATQNVAISKQDWDSFETSWDFQAHPLVPMAYERKEQFSAGMNNVERRKAATLLSERFKHWNQDCDDRFAELKANEEELNRIFIDIYGLQDELTPEVDDKDVTVRKADLQRDIKSLISYAVGCMLGRYSLDVPGLAYAGGDWDNSKYKTFIPDDDNCLPITDEEYFRDDIVGRFVEFIKVVYGADTLEENLDFVANVLGNKGNTSREIIRNYFLNDFIKDHIKIYQKRPIYWMFDSGKQNGFKALVYMHRWNADTIGNMRVEYLHRMQRVYESEIARMQETIDNSKNSHEVAAAEKRKDKLTKQLKETKEYDARVAHLALSRIDIDLDDGVKVNYEKVQIVGSKKMQILIKI